MRTRCLRTISKPYQRNEPPEYWSMGSRAHHLQSGSPGGPSCGNFLYRGDPRPLARLPTVTGSGNSHFRRHGTRGVSLLYQL